MKQAILEKPGKITIKNVSVPEPAHGEVVVKVNTALTCGTDLKAFLHGHRFIPMPGPFGHEYSGTVAKVGAGVRDFREGDEVMGVHSAPCLICKYCKRKLYNLCEVLMANKALGAFAEYLLLPSHVVTQNLFHKPAGLAFEHAALLEPLSCVVHPYGRLDLMDVETALVIGAGPIGLMHAAYLLARGAEVIAADLLDDRLSIASGMGAEEVAAPDDLENVVNEATGDEGADLVIECTGRQDVWEASVRYVRRGGTVVLFGGCPSGTEVTYDSHRLHYDEITLKGSFHYTPEDVKIAYIALTEQRIDLSPLISGDFPLKDTKKAFTLLKEGKGIKYVIRP